MNRCFFGNTRLVNHSFFKWRFNIYYWLNLYYVYAWDNTCRCLIRQALFLYDELRQFLISRFIMGVFFVSQIIFRKGRIWLYKILKTGESIYQGRNDIYGRCLLIQTGHVQKIHVGLSDSFYHNSYWLSKPILFLLLLYSQKSRIPESERISEMNQYCT